MAEAPLSTRLATYAETIKPIMRGTASNDKPLQVREALDFVALCKDVQGGLANKRLAEAAFTIFNQVRQLGMLTPAEVATAYFRPLVALNAEKLLPGPDLGAVATWLGENGQAVPAFKAIVGGQFHPTLAFVTRAMKAGHIQAADLPDLLSACTVAILDGAPAQYLAENFSITAPTAGITPSDEAKGIPYARASHIYTLIVKIMDTLAPGLINESTFGTSAHPAIPSLRALASIADSFVGTLPAGAGRIRPCSAHNLPTKINLEHGGGVDYVLRGAAAPR